MKFIAKAGSPKKYQDWCRAVKGNVNEDYRRLQNPEKESLHKALISEQGAICAYTMRRIELNTSHIEHIKPESICRDELRGSDLYYNNMVACHPRLGMKTKYRYGAQAKDDWWENNGVQFVSPLNNQCEQLLVFNLKGEIKPKNNNSNSIKTIDVLKLDHPSLTDERRVAIQEFIYGPSGSDVLSKGQATSFINEICNPNGSGEFAEFCVAIRYALIEYLSMLTKLATKRKFATKKVKRK